MPKRARKQAVPRPPGRAAPRSPAAAPGQPALGPVALAAWAGAVVLAVLLPRLLLRVGAEGGSLYTWITPPYPEDGLAYLAWVEQAAEGALLFQIKYTQLEHAAVIFQPVFLAVGWLSALTGWDAGPALFVVHVAAVLAFLALLVRFSGDFGLSPLERWCALGLVACSSGLGALLAAERLRSADLWMPELDTLWSLVWNPLFAVALGLMLSVFRLVVNAEAERSGRAFAAAGLLTGLLAFVHSYDVFPTAFVVVASCALRRRGALLRPLLVYGAAAAPACLLQLWISTSHPVLSAHGKAGEMLSPSVLSYAAGLGLPALLALFGAVRAGAQGRLARLAPLWIWILGAVCLAYLPVWFQRKLIMGIHIPVCMLAGIGLADLAARSSGGRRLAQAALVVVVLLATTPTHVLNVVRMREQVASDPSAYYVAPAVARALRFLDDTPSGAVVLAHPTTARVIPGLTGNTVTLGHWAQSVDDEEHVRWLGTLFDPRSMLSEGEKQAALRASRIDYVFVDAAMLRHWLGGALPVWLAGAGETVYSESGVVILRVDHAHG